MKAWIDISETRAARSSSTRLCPAPSLRVPVTTANRALLRRLRAAELSAWESGYHYSNSPSADSGLSADHAQL